MMTAVAREGRVSTLAVGSTVVRRLRPSFVGGGLMARFHLNALRSLDVDVAGLRSSTADRARKVAANLGVARAYREFDGLLGDESIDVVHILTPNAMRHDHTIAVLGAGRHVLCETPQATNSRDSAALVAKAEQAALVAAPTLHDGHSAVLVGEAILVSSQAIGWRDVGAARPVPEAVR